MRGIRAALSRPRAAVRYQDVWGSDSSGTVIRNRAGAEALALPIVKACVRLRANTMTQIPLKAFRTVGDEVVMMQPQPRLLSNPSAVVTPGVWKRQLSISRDLWGFAIGLISTRSGAFATGVEWLPPCDVTHDPFEVGKQAQWYWLGRPLDPADVVIVPSSIALAGSPIGVAPLDDSGLVELAERARDFGADWFRNGAPPSVVVKSAQKLTDEQAEAISDRITSRWRSRKPAVMGAGLDLEKMDIKANESQFLETMRHVQVDTCLALGVPPEHFGLSAGSKGSLTYANREQNIQQFMFDSMNADLVDLQEILGALLPQPQFIRANTAAIERSDLTARTTSEVALVNAGIITPNEARAIEDRPPHPDGGTLRSSSTPTPPMEGV